jgi:DNA-binding response OmpR family regulator
LIGEDDKDDEELLQEVFNMVDSSFSLIFIKNGKQLLTYLEDLKESRQLPCLILLDYNMPELNGAEILLHLKKSDRYHSIPKIVWTTSTSETFKKLCVEAGADDYIIKPSNVKELVGIIRHLLSFCST